MLELSSTLPDLWAQTLAHCIEGLNDIPRLYLAKGNYASLALKSPFKHLVYPIPEPGGLGVHVTLDMGGRARFGPNVEWLGYNNPAEIDYTVSASIASQFVPMIARYWPPCGKKCSRPTMRVYVPSYRDWVSLMPISVSMDQPSMACLGLLISLGSNRPASPPRWQLPSM